MVVHDCMAQHAMVVDAGTDGRRALEIMRELRVHHLAVTDANRHSIGVVSERDLLAAAVEFEHAVFHVGRVMHRDVEPVRGNAPITHAASLMAASAIGAIPVIDRHEHAIGVVTEGDLLRAFVAMLEARIARNAEVPAAITAVDPDAAAPTAPAGRAAGAGIEPRRAARNMGGKARKRAGRKAGKKAAKTAKTAKTATTATAGTAAKRPNTPKPAATPAGETVAETDSPATAARPATGKTAR